MKGVFFCAQAGVRQMVEQGGGVLINMSSKAGWKGPKVRVCMRPPRTPSIPLTRSWAKELGKKNVRVVGIAPGIMEATGLRTINYETALSYTRGISVGPAPSRVFQNIHNSLGRSGKLREVAGMWPASWPVTGRVTFTVSP